MTWHEQMPLEFRNQIVTGDARILAKGIPDRSISLIFCDPPYAKQYLPLYDWLGEIAERVLEPSGFCLVYAGGYWKDKVIGMMGNHLDYFWDYTLLMGGNASIIWQRKTIARTKCILAYRRKGSNAMPRTNVLGAWQHGKQDKRFHVWGQDEETARYYIDCFSREGNTIWEPFTGGGTTLVACKLLSRQFVAFEVDEETANVARARVNGFTHSIRQPQLFIPESEQLELAL